MGKDGANRKLAARFPGEYRQQAQEPDQPILPESLAPTSRRSLTIRFTSNAQLLKAVTDRTE